MITISAFRDRDEALISKALLEAAGVPVTLKDDFGELQLQVRDTDAQLAQEVLISTEPVGWRRRTLRRSPAPYRRRPGRGVAGQFMRGGGMALLAFLFLLFLLMPFGATVRVTPFLLVFLFVLGGSISLIRGSFKIRQKRSFRRAPPP